MALSSTHNETPQTLHDTLQLLIIAGRWLIVIAALMEIAVLLLFHSSHMFARGSEAAYVFTFFIVYNVASLYLVHRVSFQRLPMVVFLAVDLIFVAFASYYTGGANSPFLEQCYLIIFAGALYYGLSGGVLTAFASVAIEDFGRLLLIAIDRVKVSFDIIG